ncbi:hypothetical protein [Sphingomonas fuzhouensis]|nr:hypothetical protein [Sphingomonas sp. SGZ-02]
MPTPLPPIAGDRDRGPMLGIVNGVIGSLAMWALIAGVVVVAS